MFTRDMQVEIIKWWGEKNKKSKNESTLKLYCQTPHVVFLCYFMNQQCHKTPKNTEHRCSSTKLPGEQHERPRFWWLLVAPPDQAKKDTAAGHQVTPKLKDLSEFVLQLY